MRGADVTQESLFSAVHLNTFVPKDHPLREVRELFNNAMKRIDWLLDSAYAEGGRESISPEQQLRAQLLQVLYSIRSETPAYGANAVQPAVPLVYWSQH